jgi:LacI family transcriptional regulator
MTPHPVEFDMYYSALSRSRLGMMVFLSDTEDDPTRELEAVAALHQRRVDGIILAPCADPERRALAYLRAAHVPCVLIDRMPDPAFDQVGVNNRAAMRNLVEHVAGRGHQRIGYIGGNPGFETTKERVAGYRDAMRRLRLPVMSAISSPAAGRPNAPPTRRARCSISPFDRRRSSPATISRRSA